MALINVDSALKRVLSQVKKLVPDQGLEILSYKRNRGVTLVKIGEETIEVSERGYRDETFVIPITELQRILKAIMKIEFPRSRKVRIYQILEPEDRDRPRKKL